MTSGLPDGTGHRTVDLAVPGAGRVVAVCHGPEPATAGVITVGGIGNDLDGPSGAYVPIAERLAAQGVACWRLLFRNAGDLAGSISDVRAGVAAMREAGAARIVLLGWSFGGAVVLRAAALEPSVVGVATVATQSAGAGDVAGLAPRHLLFVHGDADLVLPATTSLSLHRQAGDPRALVVYRGDGHSLERCHARFVEDFLAWVGEALAPAGR